MWLCSFICLILSSQFSWDNWHLHRFLHLFSHYFLIVTFISFAGASKHCYAHRPESTQHVAHGHSAVLGKLHPDCRNHRLQFCWVKAEVNELFIEILWPSSSSWFQPLWTNIIICSSNWKSIHLPPILQGENQKLFELPPSSRQVLLPFLIQTHSEPHTLAGWRVELFLKKKEVWLTWKKQHHQFHQSPTLKNKNTYI